MKIKTTKNLSGNFDDEIETLFLERGIINEDVMVYEGHTIGHLAFSSTEEEKAFVNDKCIVVEDSDNLYIVAKEEVIIGNGDDYVVQRCPKSKYGHLSDVEEGKPEPVHNDEEVIGNVQKKHVTVEIVSFKQGHKKMVDLGETFKEVETPSQYTLLCEGEKLDCETKYNATANDVIRSAKKIVSLENFEEDIFGKNFEDFGLEAPLFYDPEEFKEYPVHNIQNYLDICCIQQTPEYKQIRQKVRDIVSDMYDVEVVQKCTIGDVKADGTKVSAYDKEIKQICAYLDMCNIGHVYDEDCNKITVFEDLTEHDCSYIEQFDAVNDVDVVYDYNYDETGFDEWFHHVNICLRDEEDICSLKEELTDEKRELAFLLRRDTSSMNEQELKAHAQAIDVSKSEIAKLEAELESASETTNFTYLSNLTEVTDSVNKKELEEVFNSVPSENTEYFLEFRKLDEGIKEGNNLYDYAVFESHSGCNSFLWTEPQNTGNTVKEEDIDLFVKYFNYHVLAGFVGSYEVIEEEVEAF